MRRLNGRIYAATLNIDKIDTNTAISPAEPVVKIAGYIGGVSEFCGDLNPGLL